MQTAIYRPANCLSSRAELAFSRHASYLSASKACFSTSRPCSTNDPEHPPYLPPTTSNAPSKISPVRNNFDRTPKPLDRPLGVPRAPKLGENTGRDARSLRQRRDDFVDYDKHIEKRTKMTSQMARSYFRDFNDMKYFKGKSFVAPTRLIKADHAMFFPNLQGDVLTGGVKNTTAVLKGQVSVVGVFSSKWAEDQLQSFCGETQHPEVQALLDLTQQTSDDHAPNDKAQFIEINHEPNFLKYWILRLFSYRLRSQRPKHRWSRYFIIRRGFADHLREALAIVNQRVGYVYLLDARCKVRWAGSAIADKGEKESMVACLRRLLHERTKETRDSVERKNHLQEQAGKDGNFKTKPAPV